MKKITFILGSMGRGGAERVVSILANNYVKNGYDVDIVMLLSGDIGYKLDYRINIVDFSNTNKSRYEQLPYWLRNIRNYVKKNKPDKIVSFVGRINLLVMLATAGIDVDIYLSERNDPHNDGRSNLLMRLIHWAYLNTRCNKIIFQTEYAMKCFPDEIRAKGVIIYNPIEVNVKRNIPAKKVVAVGRLVEQKNHKLLIEAFSEVVKEYPEHKLYIYGEGELRAYLETFIQDLHLEEAVFLPGNIENIHKEISDARVFILTSKYEGLSNALLEAMVMGIPCISTKVSGIEEFIVSGVNGVLVDEDIGEVSNSVKNILRDDVLAEKLSLKGKAIEEKVSIENIIKQWSRVLGL